MNRHVQSQIWLRRSQFGLCRARTSTKPIGDLALSVGFFPIVISRLWFVFGDRGDQCDPAPSLTNLRPATSIADDYIDSVAGDASANGKTTPTAWKASNKITSITFTPRTRRSDLGRKRQLF